MPVHDELGLRIKGYYEKIPQTKLMRRCPVLLRLDGKAFHTWTQGFKKPFDEVLVKSMQDTMKYLCENIQGCVLGYTQSDEITLVLVDYKKLNSAAWFDYEVQKLCSVAASMCTMAFNKAFEKNAEKFIEDCAIDYETEGLYGKGTPEYKLCEIYERVCNKGAMFDCRCFNIPKEEVTNCLYWRQVDATRNSIQMVGQAHFSHNELHEKKQNDIQDMLMLQKGINWNDFPTHLKRGSCCIKEKYHDDVYKMDKTRWIIDKEIPIFKNEGRKYIDSLIYIGE